MSNFETLSTLIKSRRSIFPQHYIQKEIEQYTLRAIIENGTWAPTHKKTEPWKFIVFHSEESRQSLSDYFANLYKASTPEEKFSEIQLKKVSEKPLQSGAAIAIIYKRNPEETLPEWEEIAAIACAMENMWLSCTSLNIGCYWATPGTILKANDFLKLESGERCLGLFYMGYHNAPELISKRTSVEEKTIWL